MPRSVSRGHLDVFIDGPAGSVRDALHILYAGEKVRVDPPQPNALVADSEDAGDFQLISLPALVAMKLSSWRDKDRVHLRDLLGTRLIDATWLARVPDNLRPRLQQILDTPDD